MQFKSTPKIQHDKDAYGLRSSIQLPIDSVPDAIVDSSLLIIPSFCPFHQRISLWKMRAPVSSCHSGSSGTTADAVGSKPIGVAIDAVS